MKNFLRSAAIIVLYYTVGTAIWLFFSFLKINGKLVVIGKENLPKNLENQFPLIMFYNHHDVWGVMLENLVGAYFLWPRFFWHPLKYRFFFMPDRNNFIRTWWGFWIELFSVPVDRRRERGVGVAKKVVEAFENGTFQVGIYPATPGRDRNGKEFVFGANRRHRIRKPTNFAALLAQKIPGLRFVPIWVEDGVGPKQPKEELFRLLIGRGPIKIKIGTIFTFTKDYLEKTATQFVQQSITGHLLSTADME